MKTFGKRVSEIRRSRSMTQQQLAEKVSMSVVAIAYIETGKRWARLGTLQKISKALDVTIKDFFSTLK